MKNPDHMPVLLDQVMRVLAPKAGESFIDATAGYGGHAAAILDRIGVGGRVVLVDRDESAVKALTARFGDRVEIIHSAYLEAAERLRQEGLLADLI